MRWIRDCFMDGKLNRGIGKFLVGVRIGCSVVGRVGMLRCLVVNVIMLVLMLNRIRFGCLFNLIC